MRQQLPRGSRLLVGLIFSHITFVLGSDAQADGAPEKNASVQTREDDSCQVDVLLHTDQQSCVLGENFVFTCRVRNIGDDLVRLETGDLGSLLGSMWLQMGSEPPRRWRRIHSHASSGGHTSHDTIVLARGEAIERRLLFQEYGLASALNEPGELIVYTSIQRIAINGSRETVCEKKSNSFGIAVHEPKPSQRRALADYTELAEQRAQHGTEWFLNALDDWIVRYPDTPWTAQARYDLAKAWGPRLDSFKNGQREPTEGTLVAIRFCLEQGEPYDDAVLTRSYLEFLGMRGEWELVALAVARIEKRPLNSHRLDEVESYVGAWGALLDTGDLPAVTREWKDRLASPMLACLRHSLESGNRFAERNAPRLLRRLEQAEAWRVLGDVARWAESGCSSAVGASHYVNLAQKHSESIPGKQSEPEP